MDNQFTDHYHDIGRPQHVQETQEQEYDETSDGYGNQSIEDDIQNIIFQAQQAYANKQITGEEFQMIKSNQMLPNDQDFKTHQSALTDINSGQAEQDTGLMPPNQSVTHVVGRDNHYSSFTNKPNPKLGKINIDKAVNNRLSKQNIMSSPGADSKRYIDTNYDVNDMNDNEYENNNNQMQFGNQLSEIVEEQPRAYQLRSLEYNEHQHQVEYQNQVGHKISVGNLPVVNYLDNGHNTGHFNSKQVANYQNIDPVTSPNNLLSDYYVMSSQPVTGRRSRDNIDSSRPLSSNSRTISYIDRKQRDKQPSQDGSQKRYKSHESRESNNKINNRSRSRSRNKEFERQLPACIHSERDSVKSSTKDNRDYTIFAQQFIRLIDKIQEIYPTFSKIAKSKDIPPLLKSDSTLEAQNVYSQLNFMYNQALEKIPPQIRQKDRELENLMKDQEDTNTNMLKHQIENTQRETEYYKKQMDIFKDQMHQANLREQKTQQQFEQRLSFLSSQIQNYEKKMDQMQKQNTELERKSLDNRMNRMNEESNNISFRGLNNNQSFKSPDDRDLHTSSIHKSRSYANNDLNLNLNLPNDPKQMIMLQNELKDVRSKLKMKEELVGFEKEISEQLNIKIDKLSESFRQELVQKKKENEILKNDNSQRIETIKLLNQQLDNFASLACIEFPLIISGGGNTNRRDASPMSGSINLTNQALSGQKLVSMTGTGKSKKSDILKAIDNEMDQIMNHRPFGMQDDEDEQQQLKLMKNLQMPLRGKPFGKSKSPLGRKQQNKQENHPISNIFGLAEMVQSQMSSVQVVDEIISELKENKKNKISRLDKEIKYHKTIEQLIDQLNKEKQDFSTKQTTLTKENEDLKIKFSQLLDQFQEYVNESEQRIEEEQAIQQKDQENLLAELNKTIKELEEMSKNLQNENVGKDQQIERIELEKSQLQKDIDFLKNQAITQDDKVEGMMKSQIQSLNEEISYLKKHYMIEMDVLRYENTLLQQRQRDNGDQEYNKSSKNQHSPYNGGSVGDDDMRCSWQATGQRSKRETNNNNDIGLQRQKSQIVDGNDYAMPFGKKFQPYARRRAAHLANQESQEQFNHPDDLESASRNFRSKSYDRALPQGSKRMEERLSRSRERLDSRSNERQLQPTRAKDLISGAQSTFDGLKRELVDKDRLIESKNREIVKLRLENDEIKSNYEQIESLSVTQHQRTRVISELQKVTETLRIELERTKLNLFKSDNGTSQSALHLTNEKASKNEIMNCEDKMVQYIQENTKELKNLISLASEIFLLSTKFKYGSFGQGANKHSPNKQQSTVNISQIDYQKILKDNEILQRTIYKYEGTLAQLEQANQNPTQDSIYELKRLTQNQLQEILTLQVDYDKLQRQLMDQDYGNNQNAMQENRTLKSEIQMLRENEARNEQLRDGNEELLNERRGFISRIEQLEKSNNDIVKDAQDGKQLVKERDSQLEELRSRITVIAELFEKKPISQRYSFEVLCDFVHDKAKRLFNKYENAIKDKKQLTNDDKGFSYQRKIQMLESDLGKQMELVNTIKTYVVPKMLMLLNMQSQQDEFGSNGSGFIKQLICDIESNYTRMQHNLYNYQQQLKDQKYSQQSQGIATTNGYSNLVSMRNTPTHINTIHTVNCTENQLPVHQVSNSATSEYEVKDEKEMLNRKLDDFAQILTQFQHNQQNYEEENYQLRQKIGYLENKTQSQVVTPQTQSLTASGPVPGRSDELQQTQNSGMYSISTVNQHFQKQSVANTSQFDNPPIQQQQMIGENNKQRIHC